MWFPRVFILLQITITIIKVSKGITYNTVNNEEIGINYVGKYGSLTWDPFLALFEKSLIENVTFFDAFTLPALGDQPHGVALLDYDNDNDLDIYVTNGDGAENKLYSNQLSDTGLFKFIDVSHFAGITATSHRSSGVCYGDLNNDGYDDIIVLEWFGYPILFQNNGDGTFTDISISSNIQPNICTNEYKKWYSGCSVGDINNDGYLDIFMMGHVEINNPQWLSQIFFDLNEPNQIWLNNGNMSFTDISQQSGILNTIFPNSTNNGKPTVTWAGTMVDIDIDGDLDIIHVDDQAILTDAQSDPTGFVQDRGVMHVFLNDGNGHFQDVPILNAGDGGYMGIAVGDLNCDNNLDLFTTNLGSYSGSISFNAPLQATYDIESRWFYGNGDGTFLDPVNDINDPNLPAKFTESMKSTSFGWGESMIDYNNDGYLDIVYYGNGMGPIAMVEDNIGTIYENNQCDGTFNINVDAIRDNLLTLQTNILSHVYGMATGDLNNDGFDDIVSVSTVNIPDTVYGLTNTQNQRFDTFNEVFDDLSYGFMHWDFLPNPSFPSNPILKWKGIDLEPGKLNIQINSANNNNNWVKISVLGTFGLVTGGTVNRNGIGGIIKFELKNGNIVSKPILGGSSYLSQHSLSQIFGMRDIECGIITIIYPGGLQNKWTVYKNENILFPEIPCNQTDKDCVRCSLQQLIQINVITTQFANRLFNDDAICL